MSRHDEIMDELFAEYAKASKEHVVALFLASLSSRELLWRIGLPIFAIMKTFPRHQFTLAEGSDYDSIAPCKICANFSATYEQEEDICDLLDGGGVLTHNIADYLYGLRAVRKLETPQPTGSDLAIFNEILLHISQTIGNIRELEKRLRTIPNFKSNAEQRRLLLETLGYCGVLRPVGHVSPYEEYICLASAPRSSHSSDWHYPADLWQGNDGINTEALEHWFGQHLRP